MIQENVIQKVIAELMRINGSKSSINIHKCVKAVASKWFEIDGTEIDFQEFCAKFYIDNQFEKNQLFEKLQNKIEKIYGLSFELYWSNKWSLMMQTGPLEPVDSILAEMDPFAHIGEDFYRSKLSHLVLLNFPLLSLEEKDALTNSLSERVLWAQCRLAELCQFRIPSHVTTKESSAINYSYQFLSHLIFDLERIHFDNNRLSNVSLKVDTHWGLRDQIVLLYQDKSGLKKQKLLSLIWERATLEEVPTEYYENLNVTWDPITNSIFENGSIVPETKISNYHGRYKALRGLFEAKKEEDLYIPEMSNYINRSFELTREIKEINARKLFAEFLTNPLLTLCAKKLKLILNRELHSFDVVFNQFGITASETPTSYDEIVKEKFPTLNHFYTSIPSILEKFGFDAKLAREISDKIQVVTCRAGGFSSFPKMRGGKFILTTPTDNGKMNFTSFTTAMHELGHCVEGYLSLEKSDYYLLGEVPCSAFSEAFAYLFDSRSLEILEVDETGEKRRNSKILNLFWSSFLHCGIALVDIDCWHWMYNHPGFNEDELRTVAIDNPTQLFFDAEAIMKAYYDKSWLEGFKETKDKSNSIDLDRFIDEIRQQRSSLWPVYNHGEHPDLRETEEPTKPLLYQYPTLNPADLLAISNHFKKKELTGVPFTFNSKFDKSEFVFPKFELKIDFPTIEIKKFDSKYSSPTKDKIYQTYAKNGGGLLKKWSLFRDKNKTPQELIKTLQERAKKNKNANSASRKTLIELGLPIEHQAPKTSL